MKYYYQAPTQWGIESDGGVTTEDIWQGYKPSCAVHSQYQGRKKRMARENHPFELFC